MKFLSILLFSLTAFLFSIWSEARSEEINNFSPEKEKVAEEKIYNFQEIKQNFSKYVVFVLGDGESTGIIIHKHFSVFSLMVAYIIGGSNIKTLSKLFVMIGGSFIGFIVLHTLPGYMGYATIEELPNEFVLVWANVNKPNYIEILTEPYDPTKEENRLLEYKHDFIEKRFYRIPYEQKFGDVLSQNLEKASKGIKVVFTREGSKQGRDGENGGSGQGSRGRYGEFIPHDGLPPGRMPNKE